MLFIWMCSYLKLVVDDELITLQNGIYMTNYRGEKVFCSHISGDLPAIRKVCVPC